MAASNEPKSTLGLARDMHPAQSSMPGRNTPVGEAARDFAEGILRRRYHRIVQQGPALRHRLAPLLARHTTIVSQRVQNFHLSLRFVIPPSGKPGEKSGPATMPNPRRASTHSLETIPVAPPRGSHAASATPAKVTGAQSPSVQRDLPAPPGTSRQERVARPPSVNLESVVLPPGSPSREPRSPTSASGGDDLPSYRQGLPKAPSQARLHHPPATSAPEHLTPMVAPSAIPAPRAVPVLSLPLNQWAPAARTAPPIRLTPHRAGDAGNSADTDPAPAVNFATPIRKRFIPSPENSSHGPSVTAAPNLTHLARPQPVPPKNANAGASRDVRVTDGTPETWPTAANSAPATMNFQSVNPQEIQMLSKVLSQRVYEMIVDRVRRERERLGR
ncbi:MAG TPA: hypothetical protein VK961_13030 [Chthoniobacter sp.]|nr:hypothetical protein [Chthoniobacter sp.]